VVVQGMSPLIWRRLLVRRASSLAALHDVRQIVVAGSAVQPPSFRIHGKAYGRTRLGGRRFDTAPHHGPLAARR